MTERTSSVTTLRRVRLVVSYGPLESPGLYREVGYRDIFIPDMGSPIGKSSIQPKHQPSKGNNKSTGHISAGIGVVTGSICVCGRDDRTRTRLMIKCASNCGGCNGWVHPSCVAAPKKYWEHIFTGKSPSLAAQMTVNPTASTSSNFRVISGTPLAAVDIDTPFVCPLCVRATLLGRKESLKPVLLPPPLVPLVPKVDQLLSVRPPLSIPTPVDRLEFFVKWRGRSHLHCTWETEKSLIKAELDFAFHPEIDQEIGQGVGGREDVIISRMQVRIRRFLEKERERLLGVISGSNQDSLTSFSESINTSLNMSPPNGISGDESEYLGISTTTQPGNPSSDDADGIPEDAMIVERIIASTVPMGEDYYDLPSELSSLLPPPLYLVKWKGLPHCDSTWELGPALDEKSKVIEFRTREALSDDFVASRAAVSAANLADPGFLDRVSQGIKKNREKQPPGVISPPQIRTAPLTPLDALSAVTFHCVRPPRPPFGFLPVGAEPPGVHLDKLFPRVIEAGSETQRVQRNRLKEDFLHRHHLHSYQREGVDWLSRNFTKGRDCILADEMGLGKTAQATAYMVNLSSGRVVKSPSPGADIHPPASVSAATGPEDVVSTPFNTRRGPFLVVAPLSTIPHWQREVESWSAGAGMRVRTHAARALAAKHPRTSGTIERSSLNTLVYHGNALSRRVIQETEFYFTDPLTGVALRAPLPLPPPAAEVALAAQAEAELFSGTSSDVREAVIAAGVGGGKPVGLRLLPGLKFDVLITTFEMVIADAALLSTIPWSSVIVDEAHRLKNEKSKLFMELVRWPRDHTVLLTGTPIQNSMEEVWALLHFLSPKLFAPDRNVIPGLTNTGWSAAADFGTTVEKSAPVLPLFMKSDFLRRFGLVNEASTLSQLQAVLRPFLLRRLKKDVQSSLPQKRETVIEVELTMHQKRLYRAIFEKNADLLIELSRAIAAGANIPVPVSSLHSPAASAPGGGTAGSSGGSSFGNLSAVMPSFINVVMELRKCCNHPFLLKGIGSSILEDVFNDDPSDFSRKSQALGGNPSTGTITESSKPPLTGSGAALAVRQSPLVSLSGKFILLDRILPKLRASNQRVLLFSQMVSCLDLLGAYCRQRGFPFERLDGRVRGRERQRAIDRFSDPCSDSFLMLLSTRAGGLGINLTVASTVIIFDSDWNPQNDMQAMARVHRLGQTRDVRVFRFVARKTYEQVMYDRATEKLGLDRAVAGSGLDVPFLGFSGNEDISTGIAEESVGDDLKRKQPSTSGDAVSAVSPAVAAIGGTGASAVPLASSSAPASLLEVNLMLKKGAFALFTEEEEGDSSSQLDDLDIDDILEGRTDARVATSAAGGFIPVDSSPSPSPVQKDITNPVTQEPEGNVEPSAAPGKVAKATFVPQRREQELELDDPDFWSKVLRKSAAFVGALGNFSDSSDSSVSRSSQPPAAGARPMRLAASLSTRRFSGLNPLVNPTNSFTHSTSTGSGSSIVSTTTSTSSSGLGSTPVSISSGNGTSRVVEGSSTSVSLSSPMGAPVSASLQLHSQGSSTTAVRGTNGIARSPSAGALHEGLKDREPEKFSEKGKRSLFDSFRRPKDKECNSGSTSDASETPHIGIKRSFNAACVATHSPRIHSVHAHDAHHLSASECRKLLSAMRVHAPPQWEALAHTAGFTLVSSASSESETWTSSRGTVGTFGSFLSASTSVSANVSGNASISTVGSTGAALSVSPSSASTGKTRFDVHGTDLTDHSNILHFASSSGTGEVLGSDRGLVPANAVTMAAMMSAARSLIHQAVELIDLSVGGSTTDQFPRVNALLQQLGEGPPAALRLQDVFLCQPTHASESDDHLSVDSTTGPAASTAGGHSSVHPVAFSAGAARFLLQLETLLSVQSLADWILPPSPSGKVEDTHAPYHRHSFFSHRHSVREGPATALRVLPTATRSQPKLGWWNRPLRQGMIRDNGFDPRVTASPGLQEQIAALPAPDDSALLLGVAKHGWGMWDAIIADEDLPLFSRLLSIYSLLPPRHQLSEVVSEGVSGLVSRPSPRQHLHSAQKGLLAHSGVHQGHKVGNDVLPAALDSMEVFKETPVYAALTSFLGAQRAQGVRTPVMIDLVHLVRHGGAFRLSWDPISQTAIGKRDMAHLRASTANPTLATAHSGSIDVDEAIPRSVRSHLLRTVLWPDSNAVNRHIKRIIALSAQLISPQKQVGVDTATEASNSTSTETSASNSIANTEVVESSPPVKAAELVPESAGSPSSPRYNVSAETTGVPSASLSALADVASSQNLLGPKGKASTVGATDNSETSGTIKRRQDRSRARVESQGTSADGSTQRLSPTAGELSLPLLQSLGSLSLPEAEALLLSLEVRALKAAKLELAPVAATATASTPSVPSTSARAYFINNQALFDVIAPLDVFPEYSKRFLCAVHEKFAARIARTLRMLGLPMDGRYRRMHTLMFGKNDISDTKNDAVNESNGNSLRSLLADRPLLTFEAFGVVCAIGKPAFVTRNHLLGIQMPLLVAVASQAANVSPSEGLVSMNSLQACSTGALLPLSELYSLIRRVLSPPVVPLATVSHGVSGAALRAPAAVAFARESLQLVDSLAAVRYIVDRFDEGAAFISAPSPLYLAVGANRDTMGLVPVLTQEVISALVSSVDAVSHGIDDEGVEDEMRALERFLVRRSQADSSTIQTPLMDASDAAMPSLWGPLMDLLMLRTCARLGLWARSQLNRLLCSPSCRETLSTHSFRRQKQDSIIIGDDYLHLQLDEPTLIARLNAVCGDFLFSRGKAFSLYSFPSGLQLLHAVNCAAFSCSGSLAAQLDGFSKAFREGAEKLKPLEVGSFSALSGFLAGAPGLAGAVHPLPASFKIPDLDQEYPFDPSDVNCSASGSTFSSSLETVNAVCPKVQLQDPAYSYGVTCGPGNGSSPNSATPLISHAARTTANAVSAPAVVALHAPLLHSLGSLQPRRKDSLLSLSSLYTQLGLHTKGPSVSHQVYSCVPFSGDQTQLTEALLRVRGSRAEDEPELSFGAAVQMLAGQLWGVSFFSEGTLRLREYWSVQETLSAAAGVAATQPEWADARSHVPHGDANSNLRNHSVGPQALPGINTSAQIRSSRVKRDPQQSGPTAGPNLMVPRTQMRVPVSGPLEFSHVHMPWPGLFHPSSANPHMNWQMPYQVQSAPSHMYMPIGLPQPQQVQIQMLQGPLQLQLLPPSWQGPIPLNMQMPVQVPFPPQFVPPGMDTWDHTIDGLRPAIQESQFSGHLIGLTDATASRALGHANSSALGGVRGISTDDSSFSKMAPPRRANIPYASVPAGSGDYFNPDEAAQLPVDKAEVWSTLLALVRDGLLVLRVEVTKLPSYDLLCTCGASNGLCSCERGTVELNQLFL